MISGPDWIDLMDLVYQLLEKIGYTHPTPPPPAHNPIGLVVGALLLGLAGWWLKRPNWVAAVRYGLVIALIFLVFTALSGYLDWQHYYAGAWLYPIKIKLILTGVLLVLLLIAVMLSPKAAPGAKSGLPLYTLCFLTVVGLGYYGGQLALSGTCAPPAEEATAGAKIYHANCGACHPFGGNILNPKLPIIGSPQLKNFDTFLAFNRNPQRPDGSRAIMPPFPAQKIPDRQMLELDEYIMQVLQRIRR
jgi:uncharacterized membrane protein